VRSFEDLVAEADAAPIDGWDFGWLDGRATEERPWWRYAERAAAAMASARRAVDLQAGGGELLASPDARAPVTIAAEGYPPNVAVAGRRLAPLGVRVVAAHDDRPALPFADAGFDLVISRHPVRTWWAEVARILEPGGRFVSQQVGPDSVRALREAMTGPTPAAASRSPRDPSLAREQAEAAGLVVDTLHEARLRMTFDDIGAVVYFLRLVVWTVPGFTVERYRDQLRALHERIERDGPFVAHSTRFLIEATRAARSHP
jgi:SAM-dependent methyltransferase